MTTRYWHTGACAFAAALLTIPTPAAACSGFPCINGMPLPRSAATVPANVPGFPFSPGVASNQFDDAGADAGEAPVLRLRDAGGAVVPMTSRAMARREPTEAWQYFSQFYVPDAPLAPGAYTLEYASAFGCGLADAGASTIPLTVVAASALPTSLGTLSAVPLPRGWVEVEAGGICQDRIDAVQVRLEIAASAEYEAFRSLAFVDVTVDGEPWRGPAHGPGYTVGATKAYEPTVLFAACGATAPGTDRGLSEGHHVASLAAHIEGAASDPAPLTVEFDLACDPLGDAGSHTDAGADAGTSVAGPSGADPSAADASAADAGGGCSMTPGAGAAFLPVLASLLLALRRRVSRRGGSDSTR